MIAIQKIRKIFISLTLMLCTLSVYGQSWTNERENVKERIKNKIASLDSTKTNILEYDSLLDKKYPKRNFKRLKRFVDYILDIRDSNSIRRTDTRYIIRLPNQLRIKLNVNMSGDVIHTSSVENEGTEKLSIASRHSTTISFNISYRGLSISYGFNPFKNSGQKNIEFNMNAYANRFGADFLYMESNSYTGTLSEGDLSMKINDGLFKQKTILANAYYVFNTRRFSYPAAFSQSWIQKRSSGSIIAGLSYNGSTLTLEPPEGSTLSNAKVTLRFFGIGAGYAYNLVLFKTWLFHLSVLPEYLVYAHSNMESKDVSKEMPYRFPDFFLISRASIVHHFRHFFGGVSAVVYTVDTGNDTIFNIDKTKWRVKFFVGFKI